MFENILFYLAAGVFLFLCLVGVFAIACVTIWRKQKRKDQYFEEEYWKKAPEAHSQR